MTIVMQVELARIFKVTAKTIRTWEAAGCPVETKSTKRGEASLYESAEVIVWDREKAVRAATGDLAAADLSELRRRKLVAEVVLAELTLAERQGQFVSVDVIQRELATMLSNLRTRLLAIASTVAPLLELAQTAAERHAIIYDAICEALHDISSNPDRFLGDDEEEASDGV